MKLLIAMTTLIIQLPYGATAVLRRMPKGTPVGSLLFHGLPDIIIKYKPITIQEEDIQFKVDKETSNCTLLKQFNDAPASWAGHLLYISDVGSTNDK